MFIISILTKENYGGFFLTCKIEYFRDKLTKISHQYVIRIGELWDVFCEHFLRKFTLLSTSIHLVFIEIGFLVISCTKLNSQKTPHNSSSWVSYGMPFSSSLEKIDYVMARLDFISKPARHVDGVWAVISGTRQSASPWLLTWSQVSAGRLAPLTLLPYLHHWRALPTLPRSPQSWS